MSLTRRVLLLVVVTVVVAALDLGSKEWADRRLAAHHHPMSAPVAEADVGRPLLDHLAQAWSFLSRDEITSLLAEGRITRVRRDERPISPGTRPYDPAAGKPPAGYFVFLHHDFTRAPRRVALNDIPYLLRWVDPALPDLTGEARARRVREFLAERSLPQLFADHDPTLASRAGRMGDLEELVEDYTVPYHRGRARLAPDRPVEAREIFLLDERVVDVIPGLLRFVYRENPNGAWGFLSGLDETIRGWFLMISHILAMIVVLVIFFRLEPDQRAEMFIFAAILGGAVGNLWDRVRYTYVIDWIDMYVGKNHWPTYNVADVAITVGIVFLFLFSLKKRPEKSEA